MMDLTPPEQVLAGAIQYLLDGEQTMAAQALLSCSMTLRGPAFGPVEAPTYDGEEYWRPASLDVIVVGSRLIIEHLQQDTDLIRDINAGIYAVLPMAEFAQAVGHDQRIDGRTVVNEPVWNLVPRVGIPDNAQRAKVRELLRGVGDEYDFEGVQAVLRDSQVVLRPNVIFPRGKFAKQDRLCFVIMPFASEFDVVYGSGIRPAVEQANLRCLRADDIMRPGSILKHIWTSLIEARVVIADVTRANGNVMYELGLAHVIGHEVILMAQDVKSVPFDLQQQRVIQYSTSDDGLRKLRSDLPLAIQEVLAVTTPA